MAANKKTIQPRDVLEAITDLEFAEFTERLEGQLHSMVPLSFSSQVGGELRAFLTVGTDAMVLINKTNATCRIHNGPE